MFPTRRSPKQLFVLHLIRICQPVPVSTCIVQGAFCQAETDWHCNPKTNLKGSIGNLLNEYNIFPKGKPSSCARLLKKINNRQKPINRVFVQCTQTCTKSPSSTTPLLAGQCSQQVKVTDAASVKGACLSEVVFLNPCALITRATQRAAACCSPCGYSTERQTGKNPSPSSSSRFAFTHRMSPGKKQHRWG